jgi:tRNA A-37 threonylcarbamoyl transferase component Bud32/tetratricopeptide (TPR) repeat protein
MGEVWVADQLEPVRRRVALKLVRPGFDSAHLLARFEQERQALARMDHPNIAKVLDAGVSGAHVNGTDATGSGGRPYFVMELIEGEPITQYCDRTRLSVRERLALFVPVCLAIQHAHQKGIIHRDLKPSNILVGLYDGTPVPKVIDFGVAKATGPRLTEDSIYTEVGLLVGTLEYMSPEQAELNNLDIDTRTDLYALGAILYELLTGSVPLPRAEGPGLPLLEILKRIREVDPPKPSARLSGSGALPAIALARQSEPRRLTDLVRGDLDWIVMKCLEKDRQRRYESATGLALDVRRYLADEVIAARPPSLGYRTGKFVRRNKGRVAAALAIALTLAVGLGAAASVKVAADRDRASAATDRAAREAATAASVRASLRDADERSGAAWDRHDYPDQMQRETDAAAAAIQRAENFAASGAPTDEVRAELASARQAVNELVRYTRLITTLDETRLKYTDHSRDDRSDAEARKELCARYADTLQWFGLDPLNGSPDEIARVVATSRIRDTLLGVLLEWHDFERRRAKAENGARDPAIRDRLWNVIRAIRQLCGGAYVRWQELYDEYLDERLVAFANSPEGLSFRSTLVRALGQDLRARRQEPGCRAYLRTAVDRYPRDVWLRLDLAQVCTDDAEALQHLLAASLLRPNSDLIYLRLGSCYVRLGLREQAVAAFNKALALRPDSVSVRNSVTAGLSALNKRLELFSWCQGKWERVTTTEGAPLRDCRRVVMEYKSDKETVTTYSYQKRELIVRAILTRSDRFNAPPVLMSSVDLVEGPWKGLNFPSTASIICRLDEDTFCEFGGIALHRGAMQTPYTATWKRVRDQ